MIRTLATLVLGAALAAEVQPLPLDARVDEVFKPYARKDSPGCTLGVYQDGRIVTTRAYGMANLDHDVPLTPRSVFHVASVSKQFTAAAIHLLAVDGKLSLDDPIQKHLPEIGSFEKPVTIRHLLHHTSGLRDQWALLGLAGWRYSRDLISDEDVMYVMSRQKELNFPPGERHLYSNSGYTLLAMIAARASGMPFRQFTTERIFKPLGMSSTFFRNDFNEVVKHQAYGYAPAGNGFRLSTTNFDTAGATSLMTTVEDLAKWNANFESLAVGGKPWLDAMLTRGALSDGSRIPYASGIVHGTHNGLPTLGHGGADAGYRSVFVRYPEQRFGISVLCNVATSNPTDLANRVAEIYLGDRMTRTGAPPDEPEVPVAKEELTRLAGTYWSSASAALAQVLVEDGGLFTIYGGPKTRLVPIGRGRFVMRPQRLYFTFAERGVRIGSNPRGPGELFERTEPFKPTEKMLEEFAGEYRSDELDIVYRLRIDGGVLKLERLKNRAAALVPQVADTFASPAGALRFTRDGAGRVDGFMLEAGRVRGLRFRRM
jgi:CubicO group peptidase (beta-lactamase class C family)